MNADIASSWLLVVSSLHWSLLLLNELKLHAYRSIWLDAFGCCCNELRQRLDMCHNNNKKTTQCERANTENETETEAKCKNCCNCHKFVLYFSYAIAANYTYRSAYEKWSMRLWDRLTKPRTGSWLLTWSVASLARGSSQVHTRVGILCDRLLNCFFLFL